MGGPFGAIGIESVSPKSDKIPRPLNRGTGGTPVLLSGAPDFRHDKSPFFAFALSCVRLDAMEQVADTQILLVDDNPHDAELTMRVLRKRNLAQRLVWVEDGVTALEFIFGPNHRAGDELRHKPKLILLDLKMPKLNGTEVLQRLKADPEAKVIPVVMLTSSREERDLISCYKLGVNSYIVKPVESENFAEAVAQLGLYWMLHNEPPRH